MASSPLEPAACGVARIDDSPLGRADLWLYCSPLAQASTLSLNIPLPEDTDIYMPMTSRIIQLTVLDVLATGMTLRRGVDFQPHLRKVKESLNASRYPADEEPS